MGILQRLDRLRTDRVNCLLPPEDIVSILKNARPDVVHGYPGVLARVAHAMGDGGRLGIPPRLVIVGGEVLTALTRDQITRGFQAPVFDTYASWEFNLIAWECKETGEYHTCDDSVLVEVIKGGQPARSGERGEVVATSLHSFAMPFIRYRLGDLVTKGSDTCPCGEPYSTIRAIQGRMIDYFMLPGGRVMHPYEIVTVLLYETASWIRQYQLIQEREDRIILKIVSSVTPAPLELARLEASITKLIGRGVECWITLVPEICLEPNAKFRVSRSLIKSDYDNIDWDHHQGPGAGSAVDQGHAPR